MSYTSGIESPQPKAPVGENPLEKAYKPQGLQTSPRIPNPHYPDLGFNPVPGDCDTVRALRKKLEGCAKVLSETHEMVSQLMDGSYWEGDAAVAFREQIDGGPLPINLKNAAHSIRKAAKQLNCWHDELEEFQRRAKRLNEDAKEARAALDAAKGRAGRAGDDPDLDKKGARQDDAQKALKRANGHVDDAQGDLDRILAKARKLAQEHEDKAGERADRIRAATEKLAPHEPGAFSEAWDWITENLPDILSFTAGVLGLVALFVLTGGTAAAVLLLAAAALSATSFMIRITKPEVRASFWDGFTKGEFDSDFWGNAVSVGGDVLGALPGIGAVTKGGQVALRGVGSGAEALSLGQRLTTIGTETMSQARAISSLENPLVGFVVSGARNAEKAGSVLEVSSASLGVGTAGYGLVAGVVDAVDSDGAKDGATGVDGARFGLDSGGLVELARHIF
ncbi:putative T7SS-secreted protein [Streptomyces sp. NPDC047108]|uniref:putative T7SS-secreted protein n=1 Tax=Streptomyces sp. NPDC047108 TaxID=3155025 RepID=UPI0033DDC519